MQHAKEECIYKLILLKARTVKMDKSNNRAGDSGSDNLFRGVPGFPDGSNQGLHMSDDLMPMNYTKMTEYVLIAICSLLALWVLYYVGSTFAERHRSKKDVKNILSIN